MITFIAILLSISIMITIIDLFFDFVNHRELKLKYKPKGIEVFFLFVEILSLGLLVYVYI